jgi:hypothetical protein
LGFSFDYGYVGGAVEIAGNTFTANGQPVSLYAQNASSLTFVNNSVTANQSPPSIATVGSGLVANNTFRGNGNGGCAASASGMLTLSNNVFLANFSSYNGSVSPPSIGSVSGNPVVITANIFNNNVGGGSGLSCGSVATITANTFNGNSANSGAGLLCNSFATIAGNSFIGNSCTTGSGGRCVVFGWCEYRE